EDGNLRADPLLATLLSGGGDDALGAPVHDRAVADRHHLRGAGFPDAERHEEAGGLFLGQPPRLLYAGYLRAEPAGAERFGVTADQSRHLDRRALPDRRHSVRAA